MDFLKIASKKFLVFGLANKKSIAWFIIKTLKECGAEVILSVQDAIRKEQAEKLFPECSCYVCNLEREEDIMNLATVLKNEKLAGIVHSVAFANYSEGFSAFHETRREDFLQAVNISAFSLVSIANAFKDNLEKDASVVTMSISTTEMAAENYGYMAPVKAALNSSVCFLAKSFSAFSEVRFNAVCAGLLKTSASAGIPGYIDSYLFAEKSIPRKRALATQEAADTAVYLLSPRASGINAQHIVVDAGMRINYFDRSIVEKVSQE